MVNTVSKPMKIKNNRRGKKKSRALWIVLGVLLGLALVLSLVVGYIFNRATRNIESIDVDFKGQGRVEANSSKPQSPVNILVLGSDSRISAGNPNEWKYGAQRTDAIMLVQISGDRKSINVISIPRDSWVMIPGKHKAKINAAYSYGGPNLTVKTINEITGVKIDHFAIADFNSFKALTDELGGVSIYTTDGLKEMNGNEALAFVRERKHLLNGDFDRARRQQAWMRAMMSKILSQDTLSSPSKVLNLVEVSTKNASLDSEFTVPTMVSLATQMRKIRSKDVNFFLAPIASLGRSADGQSIVNLDYEKFNPLLKSFADDNVEDYIAEHPEMKKYLLAAKVR